MGNSDYRFCNNCGKRVEPVSVSMGTEGIERLRCPNCGAFLDIPDDDASFREALLSGEEQIPFSDESIIIPTYDTVVVAGYKPELMNIIVEEMSKKNLAREITPCANGEELIIKLIKDLNSSDGGHINLIVLDVPMPYLNGINAAIGIRAIEKTYPEHQPVPILFMTKKPVDDTFKKVIKYVAPAKYAGLGASDNPKELAGRISRIITLLSQENW